MIPTFKWEDTTPKRLPNSSSSKNSHSYSFSFNDPKAGPTKLDDYTNFHVKNSHIQFKEV